MKIKRCAKSFVAVLVALTLCLSFPVYAANIPMVAFNPSTVTGFDRLFMDKGSYYELPLLKFSAQSEDVKAAWLRIMNTIEGKDPNKIGLVTLWKVSTSSYRLDFSSIDKSSISYSADPIGYYLRSSVSGANADVISCSWNPSLSSLTYVSHLSSVILGRNKNISMQGSYGVLVAQTGADFDFSSFLPSASGGNSYELPYITLDKGIKIVDDLREPEPEPEPPPYVPPAPPTFGGSSEYLP